MAFSQRLFMACAALVLCLAQTATAQEERAYLVTYIEVAPNAADEAAELLTDYAEASRGAYGSQLFQILQRIGQPHHFAILETWASSEAQTAHQGAGYAVEFRSDLEPLLYSPADARLHGNLITALSLDPAPDSVFAVTHVDVTPNNTDIAVELLNTLAYASRDDDGNTRFDVLVQSNRRNHMTVIEAWNNTGAQERHYGAAHTREFRAALFPLSGALYDERLYRAL